MPVGSLSVGGAGQFQDQLSGSCVPCAKAFLMALAIFRLPLCVRCDGCMTKETTDCPELLCAVLSKSWGDEACTSQAWGGSSGSSL